MSTGGKTLSFDQVWSIVVGSHAGGLSKVPHDGDAAIFHCIEAGFIGVSSRVVPSTATGTITGFFLLVGKFWGTVIVVRYIHNGNVVTNDSGDYQRKMQQQARQSNAPRRAWFENARSGQSALR